MADISGVDPVGVFVVIGFIILCMIVVLVVSKLEKRVNKNLSNNKQQSNSPEMGREVSHEGENFSAFIVGQVYQMEDGSLAKYAGNGQFHKIKPE
jgi:flagellar biosynthesis/type III secretory pathway M-ring protein FliF/YscJ